MQLCLTPLTLNDRSRLDRATCLTGEGRTTPLATWAFAPHYIWKESFSYRWTEIDGWWCLFAEYVDGIYMPLPPLGPSLDSDMHSLKVFKDVVEHVVRYMKEKNHGTKVTRIENVPGELKKPFEDMNFTVTEKGPDYLYRRQDLVSLKGDRYKSPRAACNRFLRLNRAEYRPYEMMDRDECLALFYLWTIQKETHHSQSGEPIDAIARYMLHDAESAHRVILDSPDTLDLKGRIVSVDGTIRGYTFGFERSSDVFCVLVEVVDRTCYGAAQFLFREFCREMDYCTYINTMDDSGLPSLAHAKRTYHPCQMLPNYTATP